MYTLVEYDDGRLVLEVVCGGIAMYMVRIPLDTEERERFRTEGVSFLDWMADNISHSPDGFQDRALKDPPPV